MLYSIFVVVLLIAYVKADCYLHLPRGSNDRLNEQSAERDNENRLFDSQNNGRGGYNVGDLDVEDGFTADDYIATFDEMYNFKFLYTAGQLTKQYEMLYFESSSISVTWTNQHGFGTAKLNSQIILQFICDTVKRDTTVGDADGQGPSGTVSTAAIAKLRRHGLRVELYNGGNTDTPDADGSIQNGGAANIESTYTSNRNNNRGRRESEEYYTLCESRSRNYGLFHADQFLQGTSQIYTRQNPGGTRYGLECQEERDYYPWWNPSPFHDIAIISADVSYCESNIAPYSQNIYPKYSCVNPNGDDTQTTPASYLPTSSYVADNLNETACTANGGLWEGFSWSTTAAGGSAPVCVINYWTKENYVGNVDNSLRGGKQPHYDWVIPTVDTLVNQHQCYSYSYSTTDSTDTATDYAQTGVECVRLMFRIRYNISTMDYDPYETNYTMDNDETTGVISPIQENPTVDVGAWAQGLKLAINTAQTGRTFQDNSHTFLVCKRPSDTNGKWSSRTVYNVNVRGKRGNIVETFPATEYDFEPQHISVGNSVCFDYQWEGSNTHNNGNPGGDGQTGDAGEGREGSDRSNLALLKAMNESYPLTYDKWTSTFFDYVTCYHPLNSATTLSNTDVELILGSAGFYKSYEYATEQFASKGASAILDVLLNNVSGAFRQGLICCIGDSALGASDADLTFYFVSTRNNNFSNRDQKLQIVISNDPESQAFW